MHSMTPSPAPAASLRRLSFLSLVAFALCGLACTSVQSEETFCATRKTHVESCKGAKFDSAACSTTHRCVTGAYQSDVAEAYLTCVNNDSCEGRVDETCVDNAIAKGSNKDAADACAKKSSECGDQLNSKRCPAFRAYNADLLEKMSACLEKPCDQVRKCLESTVDAALPGC